MKDYDQYKNKKHTRVVENLECGLHNKDKSYRSRVRVLLPVE